VISDEKLHDVAQSVFEELELRRDMIDIEYATEYSMREFISPILISAVKRERNHPKT
jgi:hypothetical protein